MRRQKEKGVFGDPLLHPQDARPRTPPRGLYGPLEPLLKSYSGLFRLSQHGTPVSDECAIWPCKDWIQIKFDDFREIGQKPSNCL